MTVEFYFVSYSMKCLTKTSEVSVKANSVHVSLPLSAKTALLKKRKSKFVQLVQVLVWSLPVFVKTILSYLHAVGK